MTGWMSSATPLTWMIIGAILGAGGVVIVWTAATFAWAAWMGWMSNRGGKS